MVGDPVTALHQPFERFGTRRERRGVAFEQLKEVALLGKQALEPGAHTAYPRFLGYIIDNAGRPRDGAKALVAERADQRLKMGLEIGRAPCRANGCRYVDISVVVVS